MKKLFTLLMIMASLQAFSVKITMQVDMTGQDTTNGVYITGHMTAIEGGDWAIRRMKHMGDMIFSWDTNWTPGDTLVYYYLTTPSWDNYLDYRETVPAECDYSAELAGWEGDRAFVVPASDVVQFNVFGSCEDITSTENNSLVRTSAFSVHPNPTTERIINVNLLTNSAATIEIFDLTGKVVKELFNVNNQVRIDLSDLPANIYLIKVSNDTLSETQKIILK